MHVLCLPEKQVKWTTFRNVIFYFTRWTLAVQNFDSLILSFLLLMSLEYPEWERFKDKKTQFWGLRGKRILQGKKRELSFRFPWASRSPLRHHGTGVVALLLNSGTASSGHTFKMQQFSECWTLNIFSKRNVWEFKDICPNWPYLIDWLTSGKTFLLLLASVFHQSRLHPVFLGSFSLI